MDRFALRLSVIVGAASALAFFANGCADDTTGVGPDAGSPPIDGSVRDTSLADNNVPDVITDAAIPDAADAADATDAADANLPPLCQTYADTVVGGGKKRWQKIASDTMALSNNCELGVFAGGFDNDAPLQSECLYFEMLDVAGCINNATGAKWVYDGTVQDSNGDNCNPGAVPDVHLGFLSPKAAGSKITTRDVEAFIKLMKKTALANGLSASDAAHFEQLLLARKAQAANVNTATLSDNKCDGGDGGI